MDLMMHCVASLSNVVLALSVVGLGGGSTPTGATAANLHLCREMPEFCSSLSNLETGVIPLQKRRQQFYLVESYKLKLRPSVTRSKLQPLVRDDSSAQMLHLPHQALCSLIGFLTSCASLPSLAILAEMLLSSCSWGVFALSSKMQAWTQTS